MGIVHNRKEISLLKRGGHTIALINRNGHTIYRSNSGPNPESFDNLQDLKNYLDTYGISMIVSILERGGDIRINSLCNGDKCQWRVVHAANLNKYGLDNEGLILQLDQNLNQGIEWELTEGNNYNYGTSNIYQYLHKTFEGYCEADLIDAVASGTCLTNVKTGYPQGIRAIPFDKFFLPSNTEIMAEGANIASGEGEEWQWYKHYIPTHRTTEATCRSREALPSSAVSDSSYWLRSSSTLTNDTAWAVMPRGYLYDRPITSRKFGVAPACLLPRGDEIIYRTAKYNSSVGGSVEGSLLQRIKWGGNSSTVQAIPSQGYMFLQWSDGNKSPYRTDYDVREDFEVTAQFMELPTSIMLPTQMQDYLDHTDIDNIKLLLERGQDLFVSAVCEGIECLWRVVHAGPLYNYGWEQNGIILQLDGVLNNGYVWNFDINYNYGDSYIHNYLNSYFTTLFEEDFLQHLCAGGCPTGISMDEGQTYEVNTIPFTKFFLPSAFEMYGVGSEASEKLINKPEGENWIYWVNACKKVDPTLQEPSNQYNAARALSLLPVSTDTNPSYWTRSPNVEDVKGVWLVQPRGRILNRVGGDRFGISPACIMLQTPAVFGKGGSLISKVKQGIKKFGNFMLRKLHIKDIKEGK